MGFFFADTQKPQPLTIKRQLAEEWRGILLFTTLKKWYKMMDELVSIVVSQCLFLYRRL